MQMFLSEQQEFTFYKTLTAYEEEFGAERIVIRVPMQWMGLVDLMMFSHLEVRPWSINGIEIRVKGATANNLTNFDEEY